MMLALSVITKLNAFLVLPLVLVLCTAGYTLYALRAAVASQALFSQTRVVFGLLFLAAVVAGSTSACRSGRTSCARSGRRTSWNWWPRAT